MNKLNGWVKGIDVLYLCNKKRCSNCSSLGIVDGEDVCKHTSDENYAISTRGIFDFYPPKCLVQKEIG